MVGWLAGWQGRWLTVESLAKYKEVFSWLLIKRVAKSFILIFFLSKRQWECTVCCCCVVIKCCTQYYVFSVDMLEKNNNIVSDIDHHLLTKTQATSFALFPFSPHTAILYKWWHYVVYFWCLCVRAFVCFIGPTKRGLYFFVFIICLLCLVSLCGNALVSIPPLMWIIWIRLLPFSVRVKYNPK